MTVWKKEILIVILIILVAIPVSFIYDSFNGNPIGQYMAKQKIITPSPPAIPLTPTPGYFKMTGFFILYLEPRDKQLMQPTECGVLATECLCIQAWTLSFIAAELLYKFFIIALIAAGVNNSWKG